VKQWLSPAKINLFLHITGQRSDGYHELQTAFQFIDYCDLISVEVTQSPEVKLLNPIKGVDNADNLIIRAAKLLQHDANVSAGALISLDKRLPMGGGLGGGSSNAATTLVALNELWGCGYSKQSLADLGLSLGADVPVFINGHAAWAEGVGEILTPILPEEPWYLIVVPDCHVSTAEIFSDPELTRDCKSMTMSGFLSGEGRNVCEEVVKRAYPSVADVIEWLGIYAKPTMTGTGACVFASFNSKDEAEKVMGNLPSIWQAFVAKGCNVSPLYHD
jgi:4-diphosphocytidyl-2-C-methyl-D-erythritol kinase